MSRDECDSADKVAPPAGHGEAAVGAPECSRWYICLVFALFCVVQNSIWSFFSPIQKPLEQLYGWTDYFIEWLSNSSNITFCVLSVPFAVLADSAVGLRRPLIATVVALCVNSGLLCVPVAWIGQHGYNAAAFVAMIFNGVAGTLESLAPPVISERWFPVQERATATAIMATANTLGAAAGFLVAFVVPDSGSNEEIEHRLRSATLSLFCVCVLTLFLMLVYFPERPRRPPAVSCTVPKLPVSVGLRKLLKLRQFWTVVACFSIPLGVYAAWLNVLDINLKHFGFSQRDAAWLGFASALTGACAGLLAGRLADYAPGNLTKFIASAYGISATCMLLFALMCHDVIPFSLALAYGLSIPVGFAMYSTYPLFFELSLETTFPLPQACTSGVLVSLQAAVQAVFLAMPVNKLGTNWMNWSLVVCPAAAAVVMFRFGVKYSRLHIDLEGAGEVEGLNSEASKAGSLI
jgi:FLVCR family MFS transporter